MLPHPRRTPTLRIAHRLLLVAGACSSTLLAGACGDEDRPGVDPAGGALTPGEGVSGAGGGVGGAGAAAGGAGGTSGAGGASGGGGGDDDGCNGHAAPLDRPWTSTERSPIYSCGAVAQCFTEKGLAAYVATFATPPAPGAAGAAGAAGNGGGSSGAAGAGAATVPFGQRCPAPESLPYEEYCTCTARCPTGVLPSFEDLCCYQFMYSNACGRPLLVPGGPRIAPLAHAPTWLV